MSWYYAENNERRGPIEDAAFDNLVRAGTVQPSTLVWRDGMANWVAYSQAGHVVGAVPPGSLPTAPGSVGGVEMGVCSESGRILPRSELVEIDGRLVSAEYKNVVLQRIREGVGGVGLSEDPELIAQRIEAAGWEISATACVGRAWGLVKANFWLCVGASFLIYLVILAAGMIPFGGIVVQGPLFGGLYWMILKLLRGEPASVGDAFQGFNRGWGQLVGASVVSSLLGFVCLIPGIAVLLGGVVGTTGTQGPNPAVMIVGVLATFVGFLGFIYLTIGWAFALPLVVDKGIPFWPAMKLSRRIVSMHWWQVFSVLFLAGLIMFGFAMVGVAIFTAIALMASSAQNSGLAVSIGLIVGLVMAFGFFSLLPLMFASFSVAYEEIFGPRRSA